MSVETLSDIEALAVKCRSDQSRSYISEAIRCYKGGAYRAAIVTTWIAVVFDLVDKIKELALSGDAAARRLEEQYERYMQQIDDGNSQGLKGSSDFERDIINRCRKDLQFFDPQQLKDLSRLQEDRHRCAHPSYQQVGMPYDPPAEQSRLHIRNAVVHVLSQPPVQGKAALAELVSIISSNYFPKNKREARVQLESVNFDKATNALVNGLIDKLLFGFVEVGGDLYHKRQALAAINATFEMYPHITEERIAKQINKILRDIGDNHFVSGVSLVANLEQGWSVLEESYKNKVSSFIREGEAKEVVRVLRHLYEIDDLKDVVKERIEGLGFDDLASGISSYGLGALGKEAALARLEKCGSWNGTNKVFKGLIFPLFSNLEREDVERIIRMPDEKGTDLNGANEYDVFLSEVVDSELMTQEEVDAMRE